MKRIFWVLLFAFMSCSSEISKKDIVGSWALQQGQPKDPGKVSSNRMVFYPNDTLKIEMYNNGKMYNSFAGVYHIENSQIITEANNIKTTLKIVSLTENNLTLKNEKLNLTTHFVKVR